MRLHQLTLLAALACMQVTPQPSALVNTITLVPERRYWVCPPPSKVRKGKGEKKRNRATRY